MSETKVVVSRESRQLLVAMRNAPPLTISEVSRLLRGFGLSFKESLDTIESLVWWGFLRREQGSDRQYYSVPPSIASVLDDQARHVIDSLNRKSGDNEADGLGDDETVDSCASWRGWGPGSWRNRSTRSCRSQAVRFGSFWGYTIAAEKCQLGWVPAVCFPLVDGQPPTWTRIPTVHSSPAKALRAGVDWLQTAVAVETEEAANVY